MHANLIGLGALILVAGLLARFGRRMGLPTVPFFMLAGILIGPSTGGRVSAIPGSARVDTLLVRSHELVDS